MRRFAFVVAEKHMNASGTIHGGMLMSFVDMAMGQTSRAETGATGGSTVSLNSDFVGPGRLHDVIEARVRVTRRARTMIFLSAELVRGRASASRRDRALENHRRAMTGQPPLPGFVPTHLIDPFEIYVGPVFENGAVGAKTYVMRADSRHMNRRGVMHGGMFMTLADLTLGQAVWDATDKARRRHAQHADAFPEARR